MRDKSMWSQQAVLADIIQRLGFTLSKKKLWSQYLMLVETVGAGCELAEKASKLLFIDEEVAKIIKELEQYYDK